MVDPCNNVFTTAWKLSPSRRICRKKNVAGAIIEYKDSNLQKLKYREVSEEVKEEPKNFKAQEQEESAEKI